MGFRPGWLRHWGIDPLYNALLQAPLAAGGRQWVLAFRLSPFAFRLSPFFLLQWNSTACNSSVGMAQA